MPRLGLGMPIVSGVTSAPVTLIDDFFFESNASGEVNPMLTTSRTNLVLQSETWDNASWTKNTGVQVVANQIASPLNSSAITADLLKESSNNQEQWVRSNNISASLGQTFTMSFYAKAKERTFLKVNFLNSGVVSYNVWINLSNGAITSKNANLTVTTELIGSGFYRIALTAQAAATTLQFLVALATGDGVNSYAGDGNSGAYVFGAQVEQDSFVSNYIPTVGSTVSVSTTLNDTSEVWDFDSTDITLEADPEDEGFWEEGSNLVLNHDYEDLGSELVSYPSDVSSVTDPWVLDNSTNKYKYVDSGSGQGRLNFGNFFAVEVGQIYKVEVDITISSGNASMAFRSGNSQTKLFDFRDFSNGLNTFFTTVSGVNGNISRIFVSTGNTDNDFTLNSISVKKVDPNDRWTLGTGWSIEDGKAVATSCTNANLVGALSILIGNSYEVTFTVSDYSGSGTVKPMLGVVGAVSGTTVNADGTYTQILVADANQSAIAFRAGGTAFNGKIDNVTVREYAVQPKDI